MTIIIILLALFIAGIIGGVITYNVAHWDDNYWPIISVIAFGFLIFITPVWCTAKEDEAMWNDMAANPTCYSTESLAKAHSDIVTSKYWSTTPFSFHKGYDFPEINVDVMKDTDKFHFVK